MCELLPVLRIRYNHAGTALAKLRHVNIVTVYGAGQARGWPYIVMELLPRNLRERLHVGSLRVREALPLMLALCRAVGHAAANQFLHLDIKPSNVLLDDQNVPKLCDFGLALRFSQKDRLTEWRAGTTEYMAPEQFRGQTAMLSERTDVYGLGALLYECLSGKQPLLPTAQSWSPPVPLRKVSIGIPKGLESI